MVGEIPCHMGKPGLNEFYGSEFSCHPHSLQDAKGRLTGSKRLLNALMNSYHDARTSELPDAAESTSRSFIVQSTWLVHQSCALEHLHARS